MRYFDLCKITALSVTEVPYSCPLFRSSFYASCGLSSFGSDRLSRRTSRSSCSATSWLSCAARSATNVSGDRPTVLGDCEPKPAARQLVVVSRDASDAPALASSPGGEALDLCATAGSTADRP